METSLPSHLTLPGREEMCYVKIRSFIPARVAGALLPVLHSTKAGDVRIELSTAQSIAEQFTLYQLFNSWLAYPYTTQRCLYGLV